MNTFSSAAGANPDGGSSSGWGGCAGRMRWKPLEIVAIVAGFAVWWPVGLALLGLKIAQRRGYSFDSAFADMRSKFAGFGGQTGSGGAHQWRPFTQGSGNLAFDEWRNAEMARLEEERRKLDAAHREFADYMETLRRAKDREEFERFMNSRTTGGPAA